MAKYCSNCTFSRFKDPGYLFGQSTCSDRACVKFAKKKENVVTGQVSYENAVLCEEERANTGRCGLKGKYHRASNPLGI